MPVQQQDIKMYLTGGSSNNDPKKSLGGARSSTLAPVNTNEMFDSITAVNHAKGDLDTDKRYDYRVLVLKIDNPLADLSPSNVTSPKILIANSSLGDCKVEIAMSSSLNQHFDIQEDENAIPTQNGPVTFQTVPVEGLNLPASMNPGDEFHFAIRRSINAGSQDGTNSINLQLSGDTI